MINHIEPCKFNKVLPTVYDDTLTYYETICKCIQKINECITELNAFEQERHIITVPFEHTVTGNDFYAKCNKECVFLGCNIEQSGWWFYPISTPTHNCLNMSQNSTFDLPSKISGYFIVWCKTVEEIPEIIWSDTVAD